LLDGGTFQLSRPVSGLEAIEVIDRLAALARGRPNADSRSHRDRLSVASKAGCILWLS
jgi:hypothetical protein